MNKNIQLPLPAVLPAREATLDDVPQQALARKGVKLSMLGTLATDYANTVLDIAGQMRISRTKRLSRCVRALISEYETFRRTYLDAAHIEAEQRLSVLFEDLNRRAFSHLCNGLKAETTGRLRPDYAMLVQAVQMAMTVIDAMRLYAARCDRWVGSFGVRGRHSMLHDFFPRLAMLLPEFAGDCYDPASPSRKATAAILEKELSNIELYDDYGKI